MLGEVLHDALPAELVEDAQGRLAHDGDPRLAVVAAPRDHEELSRPLHLLLAKPRIHPSRCLRSSGQRLAQVESPRRTEPDLVEGLLQAGKSAHLPRVGHLVNAFRRRGPARALGHRAARMA